MSQSGRFAEQTRTSAVPYNYAEMSLMHSSLLSGLYWELLGNYYMGLYGVIYLTIYIVGLRGS